MRIDINKLNFGLGTRSMYKAGLRAADLHSKTINDRTIEARESTWNKFTEYLKENGHKIHDLRHITKNHIRDFHEHNMRRFEEGRLSLDRCHNHCSNLNRIFENARLDRELRVTAVEDMKMPPRDGILREFSRPAYDDINRVRDAVSERFSVMLELQQNTGVRFMESAKNDWRATLRHYERTGQIKVEQGTKGNRPREFMPRANEIETIKRAAEIQAGHRSLIPADKSYIEFKRECYRELAPFNNVLHCHDLRRLDAQEYYKQEVGFPSPIEAGISHSERHKWLAHQMNVSVAVAKRIDHEARMAVAERLGHARIDITNSYLG